MASFKHCFIFEDGCYREISYSDLFIGKERDPKYASRYFLPLHDCLLEVPYEDYLWEYQAKRRHRYLHKEAERNGEISYNSLDSDEMNGEDIIRDIYADVERDAITEIMAEKLHQALRQLTHAELGLVEALYFQEQTERQYAATLGISQKGVNKRRHKILNKLRAWMEKN